MKLGLYSAAIGAATISPLLLARALRDFARHELVGNPTSIALLILSLALIIASPFISLGVLRHILRKHPKVIDSIRGTAA